MSDDTDELTMPCMISSRSDLGNEVQKSVRTLRPSQFAGNCEGIIFFSNRQRRKEGTFKFKITAVKRIFRNFSLFR
jgi:hypothetical protein